MEVLFPYDAELKHVTGATGANERTSLTTCALVTLLLHGNSEALPACVG